jgi:glycosyltransferase involved in cell wall biosynthesis
MTTPVRVLHVIDGLAGGGSERFLWDIVRLSDPARVRYRVLTIYPGLGRFVYSESLRDLGVYGDRVDGAPLWRSARRGIGRATAAALRLTPLPIRGWLRPVWYWFVVFPAAACRLALEARRFRPEIIHGHLFRGFAFALGLSRAMGRPLVHTVPCLMAQMQESRWSWMPRLYRRAHPLVDHFFTAYPSELLGLGVPGAKITRVPVVGDTDRVEEVYPDRFGARERLRRLINAPPGSPLLLSVGRLHPSKGHEYAIEAVARLRQRGHDVYWVALGEGDERARLQARITALGLGRHARLYGYVPDPVPWYAAANVYLRTTLLEGDNFSSFHAMAMGVPVVAFETGQETDLIEEVGHGLRVPRGDAEALARGIEAILGLPDQGQALGDRGARFARNHGSLRTVVPGFVDVYAKLSGRPLP